jgi:hypothetical protein
VSEQLEEQVGHQATEDTPSSSLIDENSAGETITLLAQINDALHRGDVQAAKRLIVKIDTRNPDDDQKAVIERYKKRLTIDPIEIYLPIILFAFWVLIFWRATH